MKELTNKPFCVNVSLVPSLALGEATYQQFDVIFEENVKVVETAGASPQAFASIIKKSNVKWIHKAASVKHCKKAEDMGADIVTVAGYEVAGHPGMDGVGTIVLANKAAQALSIPVLAAGGIADGRGLVAALALGASGITLGTRFVASKECAIHDNFKAWIVQASENDSILCQKTIKNMVRVANNRAAKKCLEMEARGADLEELMTVISGKIAKACFASGDVDDCMFAVGPAAGLINEIKSVQEIIDGIVAEAETTLARLNGLYMK
jgi:NAD(P)H-dependent flavin oxidoreductase YrpB (nitropropane dioxygenase family)